MGRLLLALLLLGAAARANTLPGPPASPGSLCRAAVAAAERDAALPERLLGAIATVESGRRDPGSGRVQPWPWTINAEGIGHFYDSKAEAVAAARAMQARGVRSMDVGCLQVNLMYHADAFASLEQAFDPGANAAYAARFLRQLREATGNWTRATGGYHSMTPELGEDYQRKVAAVMSRPAEPAPAPGEAGVELAAARVPPPRPAFPPGPGALMLSNGADRARIIPLAASGAGGSPGRGLDAYRGAPIALAFRFPRG